MVPIRGEFGSRETRETLRKQGPETRTGRRFEASACWYNTRVKLSLKPLIELRETNSLRKPSETSPLTPPSMPRVGSAKGRPNQVVGLSTTLALAEFFGGFVLAREIYADIGARGDLLESRVNYSHDLFFVFPLCLPTEPLGCEPKTSRTYTCRPTSKNVGLFAFADISPFVLQGFRLSDSPRVGTTFGQVPMIR